MEHYSLQEESQPECSNPFPAELSENIKQMVIKINTKFRNIVSYVEKHLEQQNTRRVIFYGIGDAAEKCISCVEYFKGRYTKNTGEKLYQWNILRQAVATDVYKPHDENMRDLKVELKVPTMYIMISRDPFPEQYLCPSMQTVDEEFPSFLKKEKQGSRKAQGRGQQRKRQDEGSSNPWRRPEKSKQERGTKKRKTAEFRSEVQSTPKKD